MISPFGQAFPETRLLLSVIVFFWTLSNDRILIKLQCFGSLIFFSLQVKRGEDRNSSCWAPLVELASDLDVHVQKNTIIDITHHRQNPLDFMAIIIRFR
jgi:hypothetical protein